MEHFKKFNEPQEVSEFAVLNNIVERNAGDFVEPDYTVLFGDVDNIKILRLCSFWVVYCLFHRSACVVKVYRCKAH